MQLRFTIFCIIFCTETLRSIGAAASVHANDLVRSNNAFAIDLYRELAKSPGNLVVSPFSVHTILAMSYAGARGDTGEGMAKALHFSSEQRDVHAEYGSLIKALLERNTSGAEIVLANALFAQTGYPFLKPFQQLLRDSYDTSLNEIDLTGWPNAFDSSKAAAARKQINDWVAGQTRNRILAMVPPSLPNPDTRLVLANATWFKGRWAIPFPTFLTTNEPFYLNPAETVPVPMMRLTFGFAYGESDTLQALVLPYASEGFSALIVLPRTGKRLADVESTLTPAGIEELRRARTHPEVEVHLPRFKLQSEFDLEAPLRKMGMASAFSPHADFSGITPRKPFFVEAALHAANIDVDEEGTTAASSTFLLLSEGAVTRRAVFNANRPFLFMICDNILV